MKLHILSIQPKMRITLSFWVCVVNLVKYSGILVKYSGISDTVRDIFNIMNMQFNKSSLVQAVSEYNGGTVNGTIDQAKNLKIKQLG